LNPREFVEDYGIRSIACCFSGGRSSLCATHYVLTELEEVDIEKYVLFVDTGVMIPSAVTFAQEVASRYAWNLKVLHPKTDFWQYAAKYGVPHVYRRWCCYKLKLQPIFDFVKTLPFQRAEVLGIRGDESLRRQRKGFKEVGYDRRRGVRAWGYLPILTWSKKDVVAYIKENGLPDPPHYKMGIKETCMCGCFTSKEQIMAVKARYPEFFQKFVDLEGKFQRKDWACFYPGKPLYARDVAKQRTLETVEEHASSPSQNGPYRPRRNGTE